MYVCAMRWDDEAVGVVVKMLGSERACCPSTGGESKITSKRHVSLPPPLHNTHPPPCSNLMTFLIIAGFLAVTCFPIWPHFLKASRFI